MSEERRKRLVGEVVSDKMQKTIVVRVERIFRHPVYKKVVRRGKKYKAHDENEVARTGDIVQIVEHRPISKTKRWMLESIIEKRSA